MTTVRSIWSSLLEVLAVNFAIGLGAALIIVWISGWPSLAGIRTAVVISLIYSNSIGTLAQLFMPYFGVALARRRPLVKGILWLTLTVAITAAGCGVAGLAFAALKIFPPNHFWEYFLSGSRFALVISILAGGGIMLYETMQARLRSTTLELRTKELEKERALKLATAARLASLESRVRPHFLFNTLNSISTLIQDDPQRAERMVERLASLLRFSLDSGRGGLVPLSQELKIVADYLEIEKARFGDRLQFSLDIARDLESAEVPPLCVQTLVENSVKYAVLPRREGGNIRVTGRRLEDRLEITVWDDGPGFSAGALPAGHGLENLQSRLATLFGPAGKLDVSAVARGATVTVSLPLAQPVDAR